MLINKAYVKFFFPWRFTNFLTYLLFDVSLSAMICTFLKLITNYFISLHFCYNFCNFYGQSPTNTNNILNNKLGGKKSEKLDVFDGIVESSSGKEDCAKIPSDKSENVNSTTKVGIVKNSTEKQQEKKGE